MSKCKLSYPVKADRVLIFGVNQPEAMSPYSAYYSKTTATAVDYVDIFYYYQVATESDVFYCHHKFPTNSTVDFYGANVTEASGAPINTIIGTGTTDSNGRLFINFTPVSYSAYRARISNIGAYDTVLVKPNLLLNPKFEGAMLGAWNFNLGPGTTTNEASYQFFSADGVNEYEILLELNGADVSLTLTQQLTLDRSESYDYSFETPGGGYTFEINDINGFNIFTAPAQNGLVSGTMPPIGGGVVDVDVDITFKISTTQAIPGNDLAIKNVVFKEQDVVTPGFTPVEIVRTAIGKSWEPNYNYDWSPSQTMGDKFSASSTGDQVILHKDPSPRGFKGRFSNITDDKLDDLYSIISNFDYCLFQANPDAANNRQNYVGAASLFSDYSNNYFDGNTIPITITEIDAL